MPDIGTSKDALRALVGLSGEFVGTTDAAVITTKTVVLEDNTVKQTTPSLGAILVDNGTKVVARARPAANLPLHGNSGGTDIEYSKLEVAGGGTGATTLTGILKGSGTSAFTAVAAPTGAILGDSDTQNITGPKTFSDQMLKLRNPANTFTLTFRTPNITGSDQDFRFLEPYTYIIKYDPVAATYYSKNGITGGIEITNTNASTIIQNTLTAMTNGGNLWIDFKSDGTTFDIATEINIPANTKSYYIHGNGAVLKRTADVVQMFDLNGNTGSVEFRGLSFNGNAAPITAGNRAIGGSGGNVTVQGCYFDGFALQHPVGMGICNDLRLMNNIVGDCGGFGSEGGITNLWIDHNYFFEATNDYAIVAAGNAIKNQNVWVTDNSIPFGSVTFGGGIDIVAKNAFIARNYIKNPYQHGIYVHDNNGLSGTDEIEYVEVVDNIVEGRISAAGFGITIQQPNDATLAHSRISGNIIEKGIALTNVNNLNVTDNILWGTAAIDRIYTTRGTKQYYYNNTFYGVNAFAIEPSVTFLDASVIRNNVFNTSGNPFLSSNIPTNSVIKNNKGYVTEAGGTSTQSGNGSTKVFNIAHGLGGPLSAAVAPTKYVVTAGHADAVGPFSLTADTTNVIVTYPTAPATGTNNVVLRWIAEVGS